MTDERNPQDPARELAEKIMKYLFVDDITGDFETNTSTVAMLISSQLAGAVPQEELRKLIGMWRENADNSERFEKDWLTGKTEHHDSDDMLLAQGTSNGGRNCAEELESLAEKRRGNGK